MTTTDTASRKVQRYYLERWTYITEYVLEEPAVNGMWLERECVCVGVLLFLISSLSRTNWALKH